MYDLNNTYTPRNTLTNAPLAMEIIGVNTGYNNEDHYCT